MNGAGFSATAINNNMFIFGGYGDNGPPHFDGVFNAYKICFIRATLSNSVHSGLSLGIFLQRPYLLGYTDHDMDFT